MNARGESCVTTVVRRPHRPRWYVAVVLLAVVPAVSVVGFEVGSGLLRPLANPTGSAQTYSVTGPIDTSNPFFQVLGTNGRACVTCHQATDGWTITPPDVRARFEASDGLDPLFRTNDGSNSPDADVSTVDARREAYSMLLTKGLIRAGIGIPAGAEFELDAVDDPYGYASSRELSLFRRVLPATNLPFLSTVMWDGRETFAGQSIAFDLEDQANGATLGHAQALQPLTQDQKRQILDFELSNFSAQVFDNRTGRLGARGGLGGPAVLSGQQFFIGINDPLGHNPTGAPFSPVIFTIFDAWQNLPADLAQGDDGRNAARSAVARGETLFNSREIDIRGVNGLNDTLGVEVLRGKCGTCHDAPNVGDHSVPAPLNIGIADASRRTPDLPLYTLRNIKTGDTVQTTDPGRALITDRWADIGKFKGPILRNLAARPPYFHNGSAATLEDVVEFYNTRFRIGLTPAEKADLVAFLRAL